MKKPVTLQTNPLKTFICTKYLAEENLGELEVKLLKRAMFKKLQAQGSDFGQHCQFFVYFEDQGYEHIPVYEEGQLMRWRMT